MGERIDEMNAQTKYVLLPAKTKKVLKLCSFHMKGKCRFGSRCKYIHDKRIHLPCPYQDCKFGKSCWYKHDTETTLEKVVTEIEKIWHEIARVELDLRKCIKCHEHEEQIQSLQTLLHLQGQKISAIAKSTSTNAVSHENKTIKKSYFGTYEVYQKTSKTNMSECHSTPVSPIPYTKQKNTDVSVDTDATIAQINVQKTSQPFGLKLQVFEEEQAVYIVEIANDKITNFCVGDQILQINGKKMSSVQDVMSSIGSSSIGDDIQFTVKRSQEAQVKPRKDAHSFTLRKTRKKK